MDDYGRTIMTNVEARNVMFQFLAPVADSSCSGCSAVMLAHAPRSALESGSKRGAHALWGSQVDGRCSSRIFRTGNSPGRA